MNNKEICFSRNSFGTFPAFFLDPLNMAPAQSFNFTTKLKILPDCIIGQYAKTINDGNRISGPLDNIGWIQLKVLMMRHGQDQGFNSL
jgi:hypothetical protein